jgi:hypothetical protein
MPAETLAVAQLGPRFRERGVCSDRLLYQHSPRDGIVN